MPRANHPPARPALPSPSLLFTPATPLCAHQPDKTEKNVNNLMDEPEAQRKAASEAPACQARSHANAGRADRIDEDTFSLDNARVTACNDRVPKWAFTAKRARIRLDHRAKVYNAFFRVKGLPILYVPYASISISQKDRSSGFLLPSS